MNEKLSVKNIFKYVKLTKKGNNYVGKCPFHNENTASFVVNLEKNIWKCFGCGLGGDYIEFYSLLKNISREEAYAEILGIETKTVSAEEKINKYVAEFFKRNLEVSQEAEKANEILANRKISKETIDTFKIGFSSFGNNLYDYIKELNFKDEDILKNLNFNSKGNDIFQNRIVFPIIENGLVKGFIGRQISDTSEAKYLNTKESNVFKKNELFYGFDQAKRQIKFLDSVIVVEGTFDLLSLYESGVKNAVATCGCSISKFHLEKLKELTNNIIFFYDNDNAGKNATIKASLLAKQLGFNVFVIMLNDYKDINEALVKEDEKFVRNTVASFADIYDFLFKLNYDDPKRLEKTIYNFLIFENKEKTNSILKRLAEKTNENFEDLEDELFQIIKKHDEMLLDNLANFIYKDKKNIKTILSVINKDILNEHEKDILNKASKDLYKGKETIFSFKDVLTSFFKAKVAQIIK